MNLPMVLGLVVMALVTGIGVTTIGYYTPFMIFSSIFMAVGAGLLTTLTPNAGKSEWIGFQAVFGMGVGLGLQQTLIAIQTCLPASDIPIGTAIIMFSQTLGGAIFISVAQNVFSNQLPKNIAAAGIKGISGTLVVGSGATELKDVIASLSPGLLEPILLAYNKTLNQTLCVSTALAALSILGGMFVEWKSVKGKQIDTTTAA